MTGTVVIAWLHYVSIMVMLAALLAEHLLLKPGLGLAQARTLQRLDLVYGATATAVLLTGIARVYFEKGWSYYLHNWGFHALLTLFIVVGLLSIYPTVVFLRWGKATRAGQAPVLAPAQLKQLQIILRVELVLLLLAPLFAAQMARGI